MKKLPLPKPLNLEKESLWQLANEIAEHVYEKLPDMPEEERWATTMKLRNGASELLWTLAAAVSGTSATFLEYDWSQARKQAGALKTMYRFGGVKNSSKSSRRL